MAEWWMLAAARRGWILTRGSSFGLSAAARGSLLTAAYPHPFCRTEHTRVAPLSPHARPVYTVHEHKVRQQLAYFRLLCTCLCMAFCCLAFVCESASGEGLACGVWLGEGLACGVWLGISPGAAHVQVQRGIDCQTFEICALHPPHASSQPDLSQSMRQPPVPPAV